MIQKMIQEFQKKISLRSFKLSWTKGACLHSAQNIFGVFPKESRLSTGLLISRHFREFLVFDWQTFRLTSAQTFPEGTLHYSAAENYFQIRSFHRGLQEQIYQEKTFSSRQLFFSRNLSRGGAFLWLTSPIIEHYLAKTRLSRILAQVQRKPIFGRSRVQTRALL